MDNYNILHGKPASPINKIESNSEIKAESKHAP